MKKIFASVLLVLALLMLGALPVLAQGAAPVIPPNDVTPIILGICGVILSLLFSYWPAAKAWYSKQTNNGMLMVLFVAIVSAAYFGLSCTSVGPQLGIQVACTQLGAISVFWGFMACLSGNQLAYLTAGSAPTPAPPTPV
jgi:exosortase/archaeosortase